MAVILFWSLFHDRVEDVRAVLGDIPQRTPAAQAGLHTGDEVLRVNGAEVASWQGMRLAVLQHALTPIR